MGVGISAVQVGHAADGCYQMHQRLIACAALSGNKAGSSWALDRTPQQRGAPERSRTCRRTDLCLSLCSGPAGFASASFLDVCAETFQLLRKAQHSTQTTVESWFSAAARIDRDRLAEEQVLHDGSKSAAMDSSSSDDSFSCMHACMHAYAQNV